VTIISFEHVSLALITTKQTNLYWANAFAMHLFLQFYREFTPELLNEFFSPDIEFDYNTQKEPKSSGVIIVDEGNFDKQTKENEEESTDNR
jgi:hypothetical protein